MANPMNTIKWDDAIGLYKTFKIDASTIVYDKTKTGGSASVGLAVTLNATATQVELCAADSLVLGKLIDVAADGFCTVQISGAMTLPGGNAAALGHGKKIAGALGAAAAKGYIKEVANAAGDASGTGRGLIINSATATAVWVLL